MAAAAAHASGVPAAVGATASLLPPPSRGWLLHVNEWDQACDGVSRRAVDGAAAARVSATVDIVELNAHGGGGGGGGSSAPTLAPGGTVVVTCAYDRVCETKYKGGAHVSHARYKSMPCRDWEENKGVCCPRGARCDFAHGLLELRVRKEPVPAALAAVGVVDDGVDALRLLHLATVSGLSSVGAPPPRIPRAGAASSGAARPGAV
jgi:hypothetical protein